MPLTDYEIERAEQNTLAAQLLIPGVLGAAWCPQPLQFIVEGHREIAEALAELGSGASAQDVVALLTERLQLEDCGGAEHVQEVLARASGGIKKAERDATTVTNASKARLLSGVLERAARRLREADSGPALADVSIELAFAQNVLQPPAAPLTDLLLNMDQLLVKVGEIGWVVKNAIPEAALGFLFGASGTFKSFVALDYALHRAYGLPWLGRRTRQAVPVYLAAEGGAGILRRIQAWHKVRGLEWRACPIQVVITPLTLRTEAAVLRRAIEGAGITPGDIIIDTMSQTFTGNENANDEVASYLRVVGMELRDAFDCTVSIVHHTGHVAAERPRGASAIIDNADFAICVSRDQTKMLCTAEWIKLKDGEKPSPQHFQLDAVHLGNDEDGEPITSLAARHVSAMKEVGAPKTHEARGERGSLLASLAREGMCEQELRSAFYAALGRLDADSKKKAYQRAKAWASTFKVFEIVGEKHRVVMLKE